MFSHCFKEGRSEAQGWEKMPRKSGWTWGWWPPLSCPVRLIFYQETCTWETVGVRWGLGCVVQGPL